MRARVARPPGPVREAVVADAAASDERVLAWGELVAGGWLVATDRGLRVVPADPGPVESGVLSWHEVAGAAWAAAGGGGTFTVTALAEVEPGVQRRLPARRYELGVAGELPAVVRSRVDRTVVTSQRHRLPGGGSVLLVARRVPGQAARDWSVVFDDDTDRDDPTARAVARERLAAAVAGDDPAS